jgi:glyoxylase-like metal-dependent hydrolase (beta-lactamase superfamily II)
MGALCATGAGPTVTLVRPGRIEVSPEEGVKESWPSCTLLEHRGFRVLVDLAHPGESPALLLAALHRHGLEPKDVAAVLFTHLHPDHIGHKDLFSRAVFVFHQAERLGFYFRDDRTVRLTSSVLLELDPEAFEAPVAAPEWPAPSTLGSRVYVRHLPGHTPGSLAVFASAGGQLHALAGDVVLSREHLERGHVPGSSWKPERIPAQMKLIADHADRIVPGHGAPFELSRPRSRAAATTLVGASAEGA